MNISNSELARLITIISSVCKNQFMMHEIFSDARLIAVALENGKLEMAERKIAQYEKKHIYGQDIRNGRLISLDTRVVDITGTLKSFVSEAAKALAKSKAAIAA